MASSAEKSAIISVETSTPPLTRWSRLANPVFGRPLAAAEDREHKLGPLLGVPALGLDALASSAYGPEAALTLRSAPQTSGSRCP